ncbi:MAG: hypothetical protein KAR20_10020 [Candidatus Heimdallarchaeota archaeon]|nr:hypothetical protein [Candidatus Heimdallarchaeota archaeon]
MFEALEIDKDIPMTADSSDKYTGENKGTVEMVRGIRQEDYRCSKVSKTKSIMFWLLKMKGYNIHIVKSRLYKYALKEQQNYKMREVNGILINQPIDNYNHFWDSSKYAFMSYNSKTNLW